MSTYNQLIKKYLFKYFNIQNLTDNLLKFCNEKPEELLQIKRENIQSCMCEFYNSYVLNKLRDKIPNFCNVYGLNLKDEIIVYWYNKKWITLKTFLVECNEDDFYKILIQIILAIGKAQEKYRFMHNNLTVDNIYIHKEPQTITYNFGSISYEASCDYIPIIYNFENSRIQYEGFCVYYNNDPLKYSKWDDIYSIIKSCLLYAGEKNNKLYIKIKWLESYLQYDKNLVNTLNFIDYFKYNKNNVFASFIKVKQRILKSLDPYKYTSYISYSNILNNYMGSKFKTKREYDEFLQDQYNKIFTYIEDPKKELSDLKKINYYQNKLYLIKSTLMYMRILEDHKYFPKLFALKNTIQDEYDKIKLYYLHVIYKNINKCIHIKDQKTIYAIFPIMNGILDDIKLCN
jgi:hypothetical protein